MLIIVIFAYFHGDMIAGSEVLTAVTMKSTVFWDITQFSRIEVCRQLGERTASIFRRSDSCWFPFRLSSNPNNFFWRFHGLLPDYTALYPEDSGTLYNLYFWEVPQMVTNIQIHLEMRTIFVSFRNTDIVDFFALHAKILKFLKTHVWEVPTEHF
jgi:hypothetical protein